jgi:hypothetical protein
VRTATLHDVIDDGAETTLRIVAGAGIALLLALFVMVATPVVLIGATFGTAAHGIGLPFATGAVAAAPPVVRPAWPAIVGPQSLPPPGDGGSAIVDIAQHYLGVPYLFGGTNPLVGLDCSGLAQLVYRQAGLSLPRTAQQQYDATLRIDRDNLRPGDLVFFARTYPDPHDWITHVGIYIGNGLQVNAPTEGQRVSIQPVFTGFWGAHFASGGRVPIVNSH